MILLNGKEEIADSTDILLERWKIAEVEGLVDAEKPGYCIFDNLAYALNLLQYHVKKNSTIGLHTDVDVDGVGTTYELNRTLGKLGVSNQLLLINHDKVHGIQQKQLEYFNQNNPVGLLIITDSSSNEIDIIKQFNCDVLCIDHHDLLQNDTLGYCADGKHRYVIVNSTIKNHNFEFDKEWLLGVNPEAFSNITEYTGSDEMSCGLVVYELLRIYCRCFSNEKLLENMMLYQWAGITLITDVINTLNSRNQWYLNKSFFNTDTEQSIKIIMGKINPFKATLDKSFVQYSLAPIINRAIRAGASSEALNIVVNNPSMILDLNKYKPMQEEAINSTVFVTSVNEETGDVTKKERRFTGDSIAFDIGKYNINPNYNGVIASKLQGINNKSVAVYTVIDGIYKGSFRGKCQNINYRKFFESIGKDIYAQGHANAFGFKVTKEQLDKFMTGIVELEPKGKTSEWLTAGRISGDAIGKYHITSMDDFKKLGYLARIATGNAKVNASDEVRIRVSADDVVLKSTTGKVLIYDALGLECKAFEPLKGTYFDVYAEHTNQIDIFIRNITT